MTVKSSPLHWRRRVSLAAIAALAAAVVAPMSGTAAGAAAPAQLSSASAAFAAPNALTSAATSRALAMPPLLRAATINVDLCATTGSATLPNATPTGATTSTLAIWGYVAGDCTSGAGTAVLGAAPVLAAAEGDTINITLHNGLAETTSMVFRGQPLPTDLVGASAAGGTATYSFVASGVGTHLYEAGQAHNAENQVAMGLYGVLNVLPATTDYDVDTIVLISEVDPALNAAPTTFDMRNFKPKYTLLNGKAFPDTGTLTSVAAGQTLLLRYVNTGSTYHSMSLLGGNQQIVADDGHPLAQPYSVVAQTVGPGQTTDALVSVSATAADGTLLTVFDANLQLRNKNRRPSAAAQYKKYGGAMAFVAISGTPGTTDTAGPLTSSVATAAGTVTATVSDATTGGAPVAAAEFYIDATTSGTGTAMAAVDGTFDTPTEDVTATLPALSSGTHAVFVRGQDALGNWGPFVSKTVTSDSVGPASTGLSLTPNPTNGSASVALHATGTDAATGGATVTAAEYFIGTAGAPGSGTAITPITPAVVVSLDATLTPTQLGALADGDNTISVRAQDAVGNWGPIATIVLKIDRTGPTTSAVVANPNPTNGTIGVNSSTAALRVTATVVDGPATVIRAEGFIDTQGADGTGFLFVPIDGLWNSTTELISTDIPLSTIAALSDGNHTLYVHGKDSAGNWGPAATVTLVVDKVGPVLSGLSATSVMFPVAASTLTVNAVDAATSVSRVEYFIGTDPGRGLATALTAGSAPAWTATIPAATLLDGTYTVSVRAKDVVGNWSAISTTTFTVSHPFYFSTLGNTNPPGVTGTADDSDIYRSADVFSRAVDVTAIPSPVPASANVDGLVRIDDTHFYLSFSNTTVTLPGIGAVQDEDIVYYNAGTWSVYFDGTSKGLTNNNQDIDAFDIVGSMIYFSTAGNTNPPGVTGTPDNADIYSWNGTSFARVWDASVNGLPGAANVNGLSFVDSTHFYLSFASADTTVPTLGNVQDEDIVYFSAGTWSVWFDGTAKGLTATNQSLDAIDVP